MAINAVMRARRMLASRMATWAMTVVLASAFAACSKKSEPTTTRTLTPAQRDSAIAASKLPGAGAVKGALDVSDSAKARADEPLPEP